MNGTYEEILSPVGGAAAKHEPLRVHHQPSGEKPVIGLLDNSKPNVALFVEALERELRSRGTPASFVKVTKPRSAMPCPDIEELAERCDYLINAVAD